MIRQPKDKKRSLLLNIFSGLCIGIEMCNQNKRGINFTSTLSMI